jgi:homoserine kinase type II
LHALLDAYCKTRTPQQAELEGWPLALRAAAFRFWVSRLFDLHLPREATLLTPKDPSQFERVLVARRGDYQQASLHESMMRVDQASLDMPLKF